MVVVHFAFGTQLRNEYKKHVVVILDYAVRLNARQHM